MGTIFVYLVSNSTISGEQKVCFARILAKDLLDKDPVIKWIEFLPDPAIAAVKESHMAGLVGLRISIHDVTENGPYDWSKGVWGARIPKRPGNLKARVYIYQCRDLPSSWSGNNPHVVPCALSAWLHPPRRCEPPLSQVHFLRHRNHDMACHLHDGHRLV